MAFNFLGYIQHFSYHKPIRYFLTGDPNTFIDYYIVRRKDAYLAPYVADFIEILQEQIAQQSLLILPAGQEASKAVTML